VLSNLSRLLTYVLAILYAVVGILLYLLPGTLAPVFAWKVTPFMTMTIGGWALGNAWLAWITARRWQWNLVFSALLYLWIFGLGQLFVLLNFRDKLVLGHPIAWLYLITLIVNGLAAAVGIIDWLRIRPSISFSLDDYGFTAFQNAALIAFIVFVGFLGVYGLLAQIGMPGTNGGIFPEVMSLFTLRSFGMFYLALALGVVPFLWNKSRSAVLNHSLAASGLIFFITIAAFVHIRLFDFVSRPGGALYFLAYLIVGIPLHFVMKRFGTGRSS
jgi:hypothetical protein